MAVFSNWVREMSAKYKILWFVVDMHHRERYFFICSLLTDCYGAGSMSWRSGSAEQTKLGFQRSLILPFLHHSFEDLTQAALRRLRQIFHYFSPIERNP